MNITIWIPAIILGIVAIVMEWKLYVQRRDINEYRKLHAFKPRYIDPMPLHQPPQQQEDKDEY